MSFSRSKSQWKDSRKKRIIQPSEKYDENNEKKQCVYGDNTVMFEFGLG